jgi:hypothetical protein
MQAIFMDDDGGLIPTGFEDDKIDVLMDSKTRKAAGGSRNFCTLFSLPAAAIARSKLLYSPRR